MEPPVTSSVLPSGVTSQLPPVSSSELSPSDRSTTEMYLDSSSLPDIRPSLSSSDIVQSSSVYAGEENIQARDLNFEFEFEFF